MTEDRNRRILVGGGMQGLALAVAAAQAAMLDPGVLDVPIRRRELPPPPPFMDYPVEPRRERYRDWEDRKKPRPNPKRDRQRAQKQARRRNRNRR
jgi:hypothetical protein